MTDVDMSVIGDHPNVFGRKSFQLIGFRIIGYFREADSFGIIRVMSNFFTESYASYLWLITGELRGIGVNPGLSAIVQLLRQLELSKNWVRC